MNAGISDSRANGIRYYESAHFLVVYADAAGSVKSEVIVLPDTTRKMVAKPHALLAKNKQTLTFSDGILTRTEQEGDATAIPSAIIGAIKTAANAALTKGLLNAREGESASARLHLIVPKLYKITVYGDHVRLIGWNHSDTIDLPL